MGTRTILVAQQSLMLPNSSLAKSKMHLLAFLHLVGNVTNDAQYFLDFDCLSVSTNPFSTD